MARPFSLSMRLFGNIFAEELIISSLNQNIFPFLTSIPVMFLGLFASTIQAFIFVLLTMVYISGAVEEGHEEVTRRITRVRCILKHTRWLPDSAMTSATSAALTHF